MANKREAVLDPKLIVEVSKLDVVELASIIDDENERDLEPDNDIFFNKFLHLGFSDRS